MKTYQLAPVTSPSLVVECGGERIQSVVIKNMKKSPNFPENVLRMKVVRCVFDFNSFIFWLVGHELKRLLFDPEALA